TRDGLVDLAVVESPRSPIARSWDLARRSTGTADRLAATAAEVRELADECGGPAAPRLARDAGAAATLSRLFAADAQPRPRAPAPRRCRPPPARSTPPTPRAPRRSRCGRSGRAAWWP